MRKRIKKPKGRRNSYNYFFQDYLKRLKKRNCKLPFVQTVKLCAAKWKQLPEEKKRKYVEMAEKDAFRYERNMKQYAKQTAEMRRRKKRDPGAPVVPLSAYLWFCKERWRGVSRANPEKTFGQLKREVADMWRKSGPEERRLYEKLAECDRICYLDEKDAYLRLKSKCTPEPFE